MSARWSTRSTTITWLAAVATTGLLAGGTAGASTVPDPSAPGPTTTEPVTPATTTDATASATATAPSAAPATTASPAPPAVVTVAGRGLTSPRHFTWDANQNLLVALAGSGGASAPTEHTPTNDIVGPWAGGPTGALAVIGPDGCPSSLATGLPSSADAVGGVLGVDDVAVLGFDTYLGVDGGGAGHGNPDQPSGVYRLNDEGPPELVADLSAWVRDNPVAQVPGDHDPDGAGYSLVADEADEVLYVGDPNSGQILAVTADGEISRHADLSDPHVVPTGMALDAAGNLFVGTLTTVPYADGSASVLRIAPDGSVATVWTGLTAVADVVVGADGSLYALEMSTGNTPEPPFFVPGSGRIVHQTGPATSEVVVAGLDLPIAMEIGEDLAWYISGPAIGATDGSGIIQRIEVGASEPSGGSSTVPAAPCQPIPETLNTAVPVISPASSVPAASASSTPAPASSS